MTRIFRGKVEGDARAPVPTIPKALGFMVQGFVHWQVRVPRQPQELCIGSSSPLRGE